MVFVWDRFSRVLCSGYMAVVQSIKPAIHYCHIIYPANLCGIMCTVAGNCKKTLHDLTFNQAATVAAYLSALQNYANTNDAFMGRY